MKLQLFALAAALLRHVLSDYLGQHKEAQQ
jgi:hypothetical protein